MERFIKIIRIFLLCISSCVIFLSCGPIHEWPTSPDKSSLGKGSKIRFINLSFDFLTVDFYLSNLKVKSYATFKLASNLNDISPGIYEIQVSKSSDGEILVKDTITIDSNKIYNVSFLGTQSKHFIHISSRKEIIPPSNKALIRFINISKGLGKIDINYFSQTDNYLYTDISYKSMTEFVQVSSGTGKIKVFEAGTENLIFTSLSKIEAGKIYTVFFVGERGTSDSTGLNAYFLDETKSEDQNLFNYELGISSVRFINGITDFASSQIIVDDIIVRNTLPFNQATSYQNIKAGVRKLKVNAGNVSGFIDTLITFEEVNKYTCYFTNAGNKTFVINLPNETISISGNRSLIRFVNASKDLEVIRVNLTSLLSQTTVNLTKYGAYSNYIEVAPGQNILTISSLEKSNILSNNAFLEGGRIYTVFISGSVNGTDRNALMMSFVKDNDTLGQNLFTFQAVQTGIRLVNGAPEENEMDLLIDDNLVISNLLYKYVSKLIQVNTGLRNLKVKLSSSNSPFYQKELNLEYNKNYLLFAVNKLPNLEIIELISAPRSVPFGKSSIRFVNGIYDLTAVDINIINSSGTTSLNGLIFKEITNYLDLQGGINKIIINQAGTQNTIITCEANLDVNEIYTVFITGISTGIGDKKYSIGFLKESDGTYRKLHEFTPLKTNLRFINAMVDNPSVDLYLDDEKVASDVNYKLATSLMKVSSGSNKNLKVVRANTVTQIYSRISTIDYLKEYTFIVTGQSNLPDGFVIENPSKTVPTGKSSLRFVHASAGLGNLNASISNKEGTTNITNISYKKSSNYIDVPYGKNEITVTISSTSGNLILTSDSYLEEGKVYTVYIIGSPSSSGEGALDIYFLIESNPGAQQLFKFSPVKSSLRFINGSTDNPLLELSVDDEFVATNVSYKLATSVLKVNSGVNKKVKIFEFGSTVPLISQDFTLSHTKSYSLLVANKVNALEYVLFENPTKIVPPGKVSVRFVHGAYDYSAVDVTFNNYTSKTKISNISYKSVSGYIDLTSGFNEIIVTKSGSPNTLVIAIDATMEEGKLYTIYFLGNSSGNFGEEYSLNFLDETNPNGQFLFSYSPSQISRLRVVNASPDSPGLDVTIDQSKLVQNILFGNSSGYVFMRSGERNVKITPGGFSSPVLINFDFLFETNKLYTLIATDSISNLYPILIEDLNFTPIEGKAFVRFINASPNAPPLDIKIGNPNGTIKHSYFTYQQITSYEPYDPSIISFVFTSTGSSNELISLRGLSLLAGKAYTIVVMGFYNGAPGSELQVKWFQDN